MMGVLLNTKDIRLVGHMLELPVIYQLFIRYFIKRIVREMDLS